ncbi:MAG: AAA family ATPase [Lachnospiraceae bacterium]|nr:AAA family ATPase [Lachnospiraceae bacterium]
MEIQELMIKSYGKFSNHHMTFRPGINIIYGGNESGKTTIHSFIRAMLFGMSRGRGRAAKTDEYQLRQPWDTPGAFLGSMRFAEAGEIYRIDRCFDRSAKPLTLVCESKAMESGQAQEDLDALLGGISESAFLNSVFIPQARCETDEALAQELRRYMINSESAMDSDIDVAQALQALRKKKKQRELKKKKEDAALEEKISQKQGKADRIRQELELLRRQAEYYRGDDAGGNETPDRSDGTGQNGSPAWKRRLLTLLFFLAGVVTLTGAFIMEEKNIRLFLGLFTALFWVMTLGVYLLFRPASPEKSEKVEESSRIRQTGIERAASERNASRLGGAMVTPPRIRSAAERAADERNASRLGGAEESEYVQDCPPELLKEIRSRETAYQKLQDELEILYQQHVRPDGEDTELAALTLAIDRICEISDRICQESGGRLNETASEILDEITGGRYNRIVMDETAEVRIHTPSRVLGLSQVSGGTMQQIYFALRMAAGEIFSEDVRLPVILDETFAMYDDRRLEATLRWLKKSGRQVILFTCQNREREMLNRL